MNKRMAFAAAAALTLAATSCASVPPIHPAPPPGTPEHQEDSEAWNDVDGYVEAEQGKRYRDQAFVAIRDYCKGDYVVVREKRRTIVTANSFPFPYDVQRIFFRCGASDPGSG